MKLLFLGGLSEVNAREVAGIWGLEAVPHLHCGAEWQETGWWPLSSAQCKRLEGGLDKLKEATLQLDELNQRLAEQKIVLAEKSAACEALLEEISINTAIGKWCGAEGPGKDVAVFRNLSSQIWLFLEWGGD